MFAAVPLVFLAVPSLTHIPARLVAGCAGWIALAGFLELVSIVGFVVVFAAVFGAGMTRRHAGVAALRALGASTVLPAGGLVGPAIGARSATAGPETVPSLARSTIAFTILTTTPGVAALGFFGVSLWLGWPAGPHGALLTLPAAGASAALVALTLCWLGRRRAEAALPERRPGQYVDSPAAHAF